MPTIKVKEGGTIMKKKTLQKMLSVLVCAGRAASLLTGWGGSDSEGKSEESGEGKFAGQTLTVSVEDGGEYALWYESIKDEFEKETGATVNLEGASNEAVLSEAMAKSGYYDVLTVDGPLIPQWASLGYLMPLDEYMEEEELNDFYDAALNSVKWDDQLYCMPYLVHGPVLYYRTDLLEEAGFDHAPSPVEEYFEMSKAMTDEENGVYGTIIEGKQEAEPVSELMDKLFQFGGELISSEDPSKIAFHSQETVNTFEYIMKFYDEGAVPQESSGYNNGDVQNMFLQGQLAFACNWPYMWKMTKDEDASKVSGKVGVVAQPVANAVWSWSFGVNPDSKNKDLAIEWCKWATSSETIARLSENFINPAVRKSSAEEAEAAITDPEDAEVLKAMNQSLAQGIAPTLSTNFSELRDRVSLTLNRITTKEVTDIPKEVEECAQDLQEILDEAQ